MKVLLEKILFLILVVCLLEGCKTTSSELDYAHWPKETLGGTPTLQLEALKDSEVKTNFDEIKICVQNQEGSITDKQLLFETKLAFAMWLSHSGNYSQADWEKFSFQNQSYCNLNDSNFQVVVKLASYDRADELEKQELNQSFQKPGSGWTTMGFGGPAAPSYSWDWKGNLTYINRIPGKIVLNPYVKWTSLESEIQNHRRIEGSDKDVMLTDILWLQESDGEFFEYQELSNKLEQHKILASPVYSLKERVAFDVILHEIGHVFGLTHADNPTSRDITGPSGSTSFENGRHVTREATMAYADNYLYLTDDDQAGAKAVQRQSLDNLNDLRYRYKTPPKNPTPSEPKAPKPSPTPPEPNHSPYPFCDNNQGKGYGAPFQCGEFKCAKVNEDWDRNADSKYWCRVQL